MMQSSTLNEEVLLTKNLGKIGAALLKHFKKYPDTLEVGAEIKEEYAEALRNGTPDKEDF
jgi:hypothetical protein